MKPKLYLTFVLLLFVFVSQCFTGEIVSPEKTIQKETFTIFQTPFYALAFVNEYPKLAYFNIESGGRSTRYMDKSLLRSGLGGTLTSKDFNNSALNCKSESTKKGILYHSIEVEKNKEVDFNVLTNDDRTFEFTFTSQKNSLNEDFFKIATAPDIAPVSIWAEKSNIQPSNQYDTEVSYYFPEVRKASFKLPAVFHFPDYGLVRVESDNKSVYIQEHIIPDYSNTGLALGPYNQGPHSGFRAYHKGTVLVSFHTIENIKEARLRFTVLDENYPKIVGCDFSDSRFDGLKRCWQNSFPVNPLQQCMGDNILLNGIAHLAMQNKADKLVFTPDLPGAESMKDALKRALGKTFSERVKDNGRIDDYGWESTEISLITLYDYLLITNDWAFVNKHLLNIKRAVQSVLDTNIDGDGIFESPFNGNHFESNRASLNWWDDFAFGHKDAYVNLKAYRALKCMNEVFDLLGFGEELGAIANKLQQFKKNFHKTFFNPETGVYGGWVSEDGKMHDYMFSFVNGMAINQGLVEENLAKDILQKLLNQMEKEGYDFVYGVPGPTIPVDKSDHHGWEEMTRWGRYENGGLCGQTAYHFIQAMYNVGMRHKADEILFKMMATFEREPTHSGLFPGYLQSVDWRTKGGAPTGYNYLADNYYFLLAAVTGFYGIKYPELKKPE